MKPSLIAIDLDGTLLTRAGVSEIDRALFSWDLQASMVSLSRTGAYSDSSSC